MSHVYKKYYDISRYTIWGDPVEEGAKSSRMIVSLRDGNPRLVVSTGTGTGVESMITFPSDMATMTTIFSMLKDIALNKEPGHKEIVESLTNVYVNDKPTKDKRVVSTLYVGKSKEGVMYLSVVAESRPKLVFKFIPSNYHIFKDGSGNKIPDSVISTRLAVAFADTMLDAVANIMIQYTNEEYTESPRGNASIKQPDNKNVKTNTLDSKGILQDLEALDL